MKKLVAAAVLAAFAAVPAQADVLDYAELIGGVTQSPDLEFGGFDYEMEPGFNVGGSFGWNFGNVAVGADFFFTSANYDGYSTSLESFSTLVTATYFFDMGGCRPYIGAGVGGIHVAYVDTDPSDAEWAFGYQGHAGVAIAIDNKLDLVIGYRYQGAEDVTLYTSTEVEYQSHNLSAGLRFAL